MSTAFWVQRPKAYLVDLYEAILELSFISRLLSVHTLFHIYGTAILPESHFKKVSLALGSLLGIPRILGMVKSSFDKLEGLGLWIRSIGSTEWAIETP